MGDFRCRVGTTQGALAARLVSAASPNAARELLENEGLQVFGVEEHASGSFALGRRIWHALTKPRGGRDSHSGAQEQRGWFERRARVATSDLLLLNQELAALIGAGLPLLRCIDILRTRRSGSVVGSMLDRVRAGVATGESLSGAFRPEIERVGLPELFVTSLEVGEASGDVVTPIRRYTEHLERSRALSLQVTAAMIYPLVLLVISAIVVMILIIFVIPRFANFYSASDAELPLTTRMLVGFSHFLSAYGLLLLAAAVGGGTLFSRWARTDAGRDILDAAKLRVPGLGHLRLRYLGLETARTLSTLLRGGAPLVRALRVTAEGTANRAYRRRIQNVAERVTEGSSLHLAFETQGLLEPLGLEMVQVGESSGSLETMLEHVAKTYDEVLQRQVTTMVGLIQPAMLVIMGLIVASILLSLYLPLFRIVQVVG